MKLIRPHIFALVIVAFASSAFAIEGLKLSIHCPHVWLSWPSTNGETYLVQYRATLDTNSYWITLTNYMPPTSGTNLTIFVHSNRVDCPAGQVFGMLRMAGSSCDESMTMKTATTSLSKAERMAIFQAREEARLTTLLEKCKVEGREPYDWEIKNQPPQPPSVEEVRAKILKAKANKTNLGSAAKLKSEVIVTEEAALESLGAANNSDDPQPANGPNGINGTEPDCGFYRVVRNGLHLSITNNQMLVSDYVELPIELGSTNIGEAQIKFFIDGVPCPGANIGIGTNGYHVVKWQSNFVPNGTHDVWLFADLTGSEDVYFSATNTVIVTNYVSFNVNLNSFGEQIWVFADFAEPVSVEIKIYDDDSNAYLGSFFEDSDPDGIISFLWDVNYPPQNPVTNKFIRGEFYGIPQSSSSLGNGSMPLNGATPAKPATNVWTKQTGWYSDNFIVAWANTAKITAPARMEQLMRYGVVDILANPAHLSPYTLSPGNGFSTGSSFRLTESSRTNFLEYLSDPQYRNFYFNGHGNAGGFGDSSRWMENPPWIREEELRTTMTNHLGRTPRSVAEHPYRFVFMDTCNGANGNLCEAFGIHRWPGLSVGNYVNLLKLKPRAFIGFRQTVPLPGTLNEHLFNASMLAVFFGSWMDDVNLNGCINTAKQDPNWPLHPSVQTYGAYNLHRSAP